MGLVGLEWDAGVTREGEERERDMYVHTIEIRVLEALADIEGLTHFWHIIVLFNLIETIYRNNRSYYIYV